MSTRRYKFTPLLSKQSFFFNAFTTAVDSFKHSLQTGLLPSAIGLSTNKNALHKIQHILKYLIVT